MSETDAVVLLRQENERLKRENEVENGIKQGIFAIYFKTVSGVGRDLVPGYDG